MRTGARSGSYRWGGRMGTKQDEMAFDDRFSDVTLDELREFLEADMMDVQADPNFKERLRKKLWELVRAQAGYPGTGEF